MGPLGALWAPFYGRPGGPSRAAAMDRDKAPAGATAPAGPDFEAARPDFKAAGPDFEAAGPDFEAAGPDFEAAAPDFEAAGPDFEAARPVFEAVGPDLLDGCRDAATALFLAGVFSVAG